MAREIRVEILGDASRFTQATKEAEASSTQLESTWDRLQRGVDELGQSVDKLGDKVDDLDKTGEIADAFGNLERVFIGVGDQLGVLEEQFGVNLGPMREYTQAAADVAGGMEGIIGGGAALVGQFKNIAPSLGPAIASTWAYVTALAAQTAAFIAANAPILIIIGSLVLLGAGIVALVKYWDDLKEKFPILQELEDKVTGVVDAVVPKLRAIWEQGLKPVIDFVENNWKTIGTLILLPFAPIILIATDAFGIRSKTIEGLNGLIEDIKGLYDSILGAGKGLGTSLLDGLKDGLGAVGGFASDVGDAVLSAVKGVVNTVIDDINRKLEFKIAIPGAPDITVNAPDIPRLAAGGIVRARPGGTLAVLGESGEDEAVIPLSRAPGALKQDVTVNIYGDWNARGQDESQMMLNDLGFLVGLRARGMGG